MVGLWRLAGGLNMILSMSMGMVDWPLGLTVVRSCGPIMFKGIAGISQSKFRCSGNNKTCEGNPKLVGLKTFGVLYVLDASVGDTVLLLVKFDMISLHQDQKQKDSLL